jgi:large subunit ribosomal protein L3
MTRIDVSGIVVSQIKTAEKDGYDAVQLGYGMTKKADKPTAGHSKKAGLNSTPRFFKETRADKIEGIELGSAVNVEEVLSAGDIVDVTGVTKGKGYAGVVKRHHFKGGPKTHGQSDRHRAPGSIGQSTTPGRVYKGKRMAGRWKQKVSTLSWVSLTWHSLLTHGSHLLRSRTPPVCSSPHLLAVRWTNYEVSRKM